MHIPTSILSSARGHIIHTAMHMCVRARTHNIHALTQILTHVTNDIQDAMVSESCIGLGGLGLAAAGEVLPSTGMIKQSSSSSNLSNLAAATATAANAVTNRRDLALDISLGQVASSLQCYYCYLDNIISALHSTQSLDLWDMP